MWNINYIREKVNKSDRSRFELLASYTYRHVLYRITPFWDATQCRLAVRNLCFEGTCFFHHQGSSTFVAWNLRHRVIFTFTAFRTPKLTSAWMETVIPVWGKPISKIRHCNSSLSVIFTFPFFCLMLLMLRSYWNMFLPIVAWIPSVDTQASTRCGRGRANTSNMARGSFALHFLHLFSQPYDLHSGDLSSKHRLSKWSVRWARLDEDNTIGFALQVK